MNLLQIPWARSWMNDQKDQANKKERPPRDYYGESLLLIICVMVALMIGYNLGRSDGLADGKKLGQAETWATHYDEFAKVRWVFEEADRVRMYEKR